MVINHLLTGMNPPQKKTFTNFHATEKGDTSYGDHWHFGIFAKAQGIIKLWQVSWNPLHILAS